MAEKKRQCGTCRFFAQSEAGGKGKCTHPKRDRAHLDLLLLRPNELGCRTRWGTSMWQDPADDRDPASIETPQQPTLPEPIPAQLHYDDEVTSVSIAGSKTSRSSFEDDVVDSGAVASGVGSWSDTVQEERRRLLMHSDRDALAGARKRHMEKQTRQRELIPFADDDPQNATSDEDDAPTKAAPDPVAASSESFPPDDFVEEERASESDTMETDDALVDDGVRPAGTRSPRVQKLLRETKPPKNHKAMGLGAPAEMTVTSHNPEQREQWNTVPSMTPGFELPLMAPRMNQPTSSTPLRVSASAASAAYSQSPSRPVSQARELLSEDRLRQERARRQISVPMADSKPAEPKEDVKSETVTNRPRLSQAQPQHTPPVERLKSSPLRGYHPAVKAAAARNQQATSRPVTDRQPRSTTPPTPTERTHQRPMERDNIAPSPVQRRPNVYTDQTPRQPRHQQPERAAIRRPQTEPQRPRDNTPFVRSSIRVAPQVPRNCGTCTSFRESGVEGRGSCANEFAGPVQRVVNEQELSCQHTFGSFWLPADEEVWLEELNEKYPSTPRVDRMIARRTERRTVVLPDLEELTS